MADSFFLTINKFFETFLFFDIFFFSENLTLPFISTFLLFFAVFFTLKMGFVNVRLFKHAIELVSGKHDKVTKEGEISHFKALTTALSATVGLGNIAGVAVAISVGGPGAVFWMILAGILGMSTKFTECTLGVMFRKKRKNGQFMGGPMEYLKRGLEKEGYPLLGKVLSIVFCVMCLGGSFGGGTAFQVNQSLNAISLIFPFLENYKWVYGLLVAFLVGLVIIGGLKRIASVTGRIVPLMCSVYVLTALFILVSHYRDIPDAFLTIIQSAFTLHSAYGGFLGVLVTGINRAAFSNEAGLGSSPIAHAGAKVSHPVEEGVVALLEPFIDTVVICTMTALVIIVTGAYDNTAYAELVAQQKGAALTSAAMAETVHWFPYVLGASVFLFAFSTIISWSYYGERCCSFLFQERFAIYYKILVLIIIVLSAMASSTTIMEFGDIMILGMAFPNLIGVFMLRNRVKEALTDYKSKVFVKSVESKS